MVRTEAMLPSDEELNLLSTSYIDFKATSLPTLMSLDLKLELLCKNIEKLDMSNKKIQNKSKLKRRYIKNY